MKDTLNALHEVLKQREAGLINNEETMNAVLEKVVGHYDLGSGSVTFNRTSPIIIVG